MTGKSYELTWLPAGWMDEFVPAPLRHPTDFLHRCDDGLYIVIPKESKDDLRPEGGIEDQEHLLFKVAEGDIVRFLPHESYGTFTLHIRDDLSYRVVGDYPSQANHFYLPDTEAIGDSIDDLIQQSSEGNGQIAPGVYEIDVYWWGNDVAFRFEGHENGAVRLVKVGEVH
ncbi:hypothetical protein F9K81_11675 [Brucella anthropi]|uniref:hypothetical protein n=1 Tax=Brucella anthropi TaxID=529 RepID=UPI00124DD88E|nr:hypothetical protein [Brucella anthropi]KAB2758002.1 hypothetical protein F9K81_11675 [Brucella anthropi]